MATALKPFFNDHTRALVNPGEQVIGCTENELAGMERSGLIRRATPKVTVAETPRTSVQVGDPAIAADAAGDAGLSVPATSVGRTVTTKRTLRSAIDGE